MRAWLVFVDQVPPPAVRYPSFQYGGLIRKFQVLSAEEFAGTIACRPFKSRFYRRMGQAGLPQEDIDTHWTTYARPSAMETTLAVAGPWLMGEQSTHAGICVAPLIDRIDDLGYRRLWEGLPCVTDWPRRVRARPAHLSTFYVGSWLSDQYPDIDYRAGTSRRRSCAGGSAVEEWAGRHLTCETFGFSSGRHNGIVV
jgi:glutathione S-transferase